MDCISAYLKLDRFAQRKLWIGVLQVRASLEVRNEGLID
jgi:hypothetical protein